MQINIRGKNIQITDALRDYATKKVERMAKFFDRPAEAQVMLTVEKDRHTVEVTIMVNSLILRGEESSPDMYASIDMVMDKLEKQVDRYKTRIGRRLRNESIRTTAVGDWTEDDDEPRVVRSKRFAMKPMAVEEAILQMNLLNHDFFVFISAETETFAVVYKRKDGNYGLIEPDV